MKIEVLYVSDCPNHAPTIERVKQVLASESLHVPVDEVLVSNESEAKALQFLGSPTVRVNGRDVEPVENAMPGLSCRIYDNFSGVPSQESVRRAISAAKGCHS
jgi:hypothetical protein